MNETNLSLIDIIRIAENNPNSTSITSEVVEYIDENGNSVTKYYVLA